MHNYCWPILLHPNRVTWQDNRNMTIYEERWGPIALPLLCFCHSVVCDDIWLSLWIWSRNSILVFLHLCIINMDLSTSSYLTKNLSIFFHRKWCRYSLKFQWSVKLDAGKKPQTSFLPSLVLFYQEFWWVCRHLCFVLLITSLLTLPHCW